MRGPLAVCESQGSTWREVISEESLELGWFAPDELEGLNTDPSVSRLFDLTFG